VDVMVKQLDGATYLFASGPSAATSARAALGFAAADTAAALAATGANVVTLDRFRDLVIHSTDVVGGSIVGGSFSGALGVVPVGGAAPLATVEHSPDPAFVCLQAPPTNFHVRLSDSAGGAVDLGGAEWSMVLAFE